MGWRERTAAIVVGAGMTLALCGGAWAQSGGHTDLSEARARWEQLDPAARRKLRERFERLQRMDPAERREMESRMRSLQRAEREAGAELSDDVRAELEAMGPMERKRLMREFARQRLSERGRDLLARMPAEWRERLESAPPHERWKIMRELKTSMRDSGAERAIDGLAKSLDLPPTEVERLRALEGEALWSEIMRLRREDVDERVRTRGLPPWMSEGEWAEVQGLEGRPFFERLNELRRRRSARQQGPRFEELHRLSRPDPQWMIELSELPFRERKLEVGRRVRDRLVEFLEGQPDLAGPEDLDRLRALEGPRLLESVRSWARARRDARSEGGEHTPRSRRGGAAPRRP